MNTARRFKKYIKQSGQATTSDSFQGLEKQTKTEDKNDDGQYKIKATRIKLVDLMVDHSPFFKIIISPDWARLFAFCNSSRFFTSMFFDKESKEIDGKSMGQQ